MSQCEIELCIFTCDSRERERDRERPVSNEKTIFFQFMRMEAWEAKSGNSSVLVANLLPIRIIILKGKSKL